MNSLPTTETAVHFHRLIFGGLVALLPALMAAKGCAVAEIGSDERVCGGLEALSCDAGEFCKYSDDSCSPGDETGVCEPVPEVCGEIYAPVCGCDDKTYDNECLANAEGVSVASDGKCGQPSDVCGPMEEECGEGEFCKYPISASCGTDTEAGVCTPKPETCTLDDVPVCGCDGETYSNACEADAEGVSVASDGECDQPSKVCGGWTSEKCDEGEFCDYPNDSCAKADGVGVCKPVPESCDGNYDPVCGCDGETYSNICEATREGMSSVSPGECPEPSSVCGSMALECDDGEFCKYPPSSSCVSFADEGVCVPIPELCGEIYAPVCTCTGETYDNECLADAARAFIAFEGTCAQPSNTCGFTGGVCDEGEFCNYPLDAMCGVGPAVDATGTCEPIPDGCDDNYDPMCGCDGETYSNECNAHMAGTPVAYAGECFEEGQVCGGLVGGLCDEGEFCNIPLERSCGGTDESGLCEPIPEGCTTDYDPVCGCDGETYGNECEARAASVSIQALGECNE